MTEEAGKGGSWWGTIPGILTATAAVITAVSGLVAILAQNGVFGDKAKSVVASASPSPGVGKSGESAAPSSPSASTAAASGIVATPLHPVPFTGAIVTLLDGSTIKLRDDVKEYCQGRPVLKSVAGQLIEMQRIRRFELSDWRERDGKGNAHIVLNNGEAMDVRIEGCAMVGSNDLGDYHGGFESIRAVEFVR